MEFKSISVLISLMILFREIHSHGMMLVPPNRSSLWRFNSSAPKNYDDNQNFCGGFGVQWGKFGGKCGPCGDRYDDPHPQNNENTGKFGRGVIVAQYTSGSIIDVHILLTANHLGYFKYSLCNLKDSKLPEYGESCFLTLKLANGSPKYAVSKSDTLIYNQVKLPNKLTCDRCVLRWHYTAGNNWGNCGNGTSMLGCGPQEMFRSCADIRIL
ncbi:Chitin bind 3 domain containing protein [Asbolus verrucosus]|uniref:Chitin bind 3 domain containing protein n=1 Tax=Asbolus verrucosus TaxID=1661398 RepID=A0A482VPR5_ASBVE|nr:Chitin bind 3 domain containing protein [Asbolus verrucosus]